MTSAAFSAASASAGPGVLTTKALKKGKVGVWRYFALFGETAAFLFLALALFSFSAADPPAPHVWPWNEPALNWCGTVGAHIAYWVHSLIGWGAWVALALWGVRLFVTAFITSVSHVAVRALGVVVMATAAAAAQSLVLPRTGAIADLGGGMLGTLAADTLFTRFGTMGALLWIGLAFLVGATVAVDIWVVLAPLWAYKQARAAAGPTAFAVSTAASATGKGMSRVGKLLAKFRKTDPNRRETAETVDLVVKGRKKPKVDGAKEAIDENAGGIGGTEAFTPEEHTVAVDEDGEVVAAADAASDEEAGEPEAAQPALAPEEKKGFTPEQLREKIAKLPLRFASVEKRSATEDDLRDIQNSSDMEGYQFPGLDLLEEPEVNFTQTMEAYVREQATALEKSLKEYRIDGEVVGIESGPVITLYEIRLAPGTKVSALGAVASDLARSLKAVNVRIVANTEGRDTVGIEVPNAKKEKVRLKELMGKRERFAGMQLPMFLGKDASGTPLIADLTKMPHMLIAGTTGSGKSVCMSTILMSFLYTKKPNELKLVLVDPKMVELSQFKDVPHLMCPVVTEMSKAAQILEWAVRKMDERYELLVEAGCVNIASYNALTWDELKERFKPTDAVEEARIPKKLPFMVFVIDELADLMMTNKEVETAIIRLAQKARAVGMHLILATQRPQANVVTGLIKSNMPSRIAFKVASGMDSRIVMDQKGGELLLGQGDMLFLSPRSSELTRAQGTLVDDKEIRRVVTFLKEIATPTFERSLMQIRTGSDAAGSLGDNAPEIDAGDVTGGLSHDGIAKGQTDPLFDRAVEVVLEAQKGSVSMLQRRLAIGYNRSSRLIDAMWKAGIVGDHKGTVDRDVLISIEEWHAMKAQAAADAAAASEPAAPGAQTSLFETKPPASAAINTAANPTIQVPSRAKLPQSAGPVPTSTAARLDGGIEDEASAPDSEDNAPFDDGDAT
ncbi:MAG: DNA translocase FtsK 4TM domain-containing protein [Phycisphaerales bacterium]